MSEDMTPESRARGAVVSTGGGGRVKRILFTVLLYGLLLAGCTRAEGITPAPLVTAATDQPTYVPRGTLPSTGGAAVVVQRSGGIAGTTDQWAIFPDGRVLVGRTNQFRVQPAAVTGLMAAIERRGFYTVELPPPQPCPDCYVYTITVSSGGRVHSVSWVDGQGGVPHEVLDVFNDINVFLSAPGSD
jgi:hypothetical protein